MSETKDILKLKMLENHFPTSEWVERGLNASSELEIKQMNKEVIQFIDFLIANLDLEEDERLNKIQSWFNEWDSFDFDTEETEFIVDKMAEIMNLAKINHETLLI